MDLSVSSDDSEPGLSPTSAMDLADLRDQRLRKKVVQVVYCLNIEGRIDHPHLIEGAIAADGDGLRLRDFKLWLASMRGSAMPESFSWSCKRKYKGAFVWHDLSDDDLVLPLQSNEYVLMGSEIRPCSNFHRQGSMRTALGVPSTVSPAAGIHGSSAVVMKSRDLKRSMSAAEECVLVAEIDDGDHKAKYFSSSLPIRSPSKGFHSRAVGSPLPEAIYGVAAAAQVARRPPAVAETPVSAAATDSGFTQLSDREVGGSTIAAAVGRRRQTASRFGGVVGSHEKPQKQKQEEEEVRVYSRAMPREQVSDAATQTDESKRNSMDGSPSTSCQLPKRSSASSPSGGISMMRHEQQVAAGEEYWNPCSVLSNMSSSEAAAALFSPGSSAYSTVMETVSPGSARSFKSINSVNSTGSAGYRAASAVAAGIYPATSASSAAAVILPPPSPGGGKGSQQQQVVQNLIPCGLVDIDEASILSMKHLTTLQEATKAPRPQTDISSAVATAVHVAEAIGSSGRRSLSSVDSRRTSPSCSDRKATPATWDRRASGSGRYRRSASDRHLMMTPTEGQEPSPPPMGRSWFCRPCRQSSSSSCFANQEVLSGASTPRGAEALAKVGGGGGTPGNGQVSAGKKGLTIWPPSPRTRSECTHFYTIL